MGQLNMETIARDPAIPSKPDDFNKVAAAIDFGAATYVGKKVKMKPSVNGDYIPTSKAQIFYDATTKNKSFTEMSKVLKTLNVKNHLFMLTLYDKSLAGIDPYDPFLPDDTKRRIMHEIYNNPWYYLREVCRIPIEGGEPAPFRIHIGTLSAVFLSLYNMNYYLELPRQTGKTIGEAAFLSWLYNFRARKLTIGMFNYENDKVIKNIAHVMEILDSIPTWLQFHKVKEGSDGIFKDVGKDRGKQMSAKHHVNLAEIKGKTTGTTKNTARNAGRGASMAKQNWDEIGWCKFNWIAYDSAIYATSASIKNARKNGMPYGVSMTSTPPDMGSDEGKWLHNFVFNEMLKFEPFMFDFDKATLTRWLGKYAKKDYFFISYDYRELGFSEEWLKERWRNSGTVEAFLRDIRLVWAKDRKGSPFPEHLDPLKGVVESIKYKPLIVDSDYLFKTYPGYEKAKFKKIVMGCDVASGGGGDNDSSTIVGVDPDTTEVLFTFASNNIDTIEFAHVIACAMRDVAPKGIPVIERNGLGVTVTSALKRIDWASDRMYYSNYTESHAMKKATADTVRGGKKYMYGLINHQKIRQILYNEILVKRVQEYKELFKSTDIVEQIENLVIDPRTDRIDHRHKTHDDLVMGYMFALFVLLRDRDLMFKFGIKTPIPKSDISDEEKSLLSEYELDEPNVDELEAEDAYFEELEAKMSKADSFDAMRIQAMKRKQAKLNRALLEDEGIESINKTLEFDDSELINEDRSKGAYNPMKEIFDDTPDDDSSFESLFGSNGGGNGDYDPFADY